MKFDTKLKRFLLICVVSMLIVLAIVSIVAYFPVETTFTYKVSISMFVVGLLGTILCTIVWKGKCMIEVGTQEKIVEFEIPTFGKTETCTVLEFSKDENEELEIEIPAFMRG